MPIALRGIEISGLLFEGCKCGIFVKKEQLFDDASIATSSADDDNDVDEKAARTVATRRSAMAKGRKSSLLAGLADSDDETHGSTSNCKRLVLHHHHNHYQCVRNLLLYEDVGTYCSLECKSEHNVKISRPKEAVTANGEAKGTPHTLRSFRLAFRLRSSTAQRLYPSPLRGGRAVSLWNRIKRRQLPYWLVYVNFAVLWAVGILLSYLVLLTTAQLVMEMDEKVVLQSSFGSIAS